MATTPILPTGRLEKAAGDIPELWLPRADIFSRRSERLRSLAVGNALQSYLDFLAELTSGQQQALNEHPAIPVPDTHFLNVCREHAMPPLAPAGRPFHPHWHEIARRLTQSAGDRLPNQGRAALQPLMEGNEAWLNAQAQYLVAGNFALVEQTTSPFLAAALQVQWAYLARQLDPADMGSDSPQALCPVCGSHPVAGIIKTDTASRGLRYLQCTLCGSEWHVVRAQCSQCGNDKNISYRSLDTLPNAGRAEYCPSCRSYLKLFSQEHSPLADPVADDLATVALDMLMDEQGAVKSGFNFFLLPTPSPSLR